MLIMAKTSTNHNNSTHVRERYFAQCVDHNVCTTKSTSIEKFCLKKLTPYFCCYDPLHQMKTVPNDKFYALLSRQICDNECTKHFSNSAQEIMLR